MKLVNIMDKKVLIATNNMAKVDLYREVLNEIGLDAVSPKELGLHVEIDENGATEVENAKIKALAFYEKAHMPVIANDSGLYIDRFSDEDQPNLFVRRFGGRELSDEEMIDIYSKKLLEVGGESEGHYIVGLALVDGDGKLFAKEFKPKRHFVATPSKTRVKGFPLSSIAFDKKTNKYLCEMTPAEKIAYEADVMQAQKDFIFSHISSH